FRRVCQVLKGWQFEIVWKNRDQHGRIIQNDAPLPQWPRHARWFAVLQPLRQLISLASADIQVQFRAGEIQPIGNSAEVLGLVSYVSDLRGPEIGLRSVPGLLDARRHLFGPVRLLALENACGTLHHGGSVLNGKALSPARRRLFEVFLDESQGGGMGPFWRHPRQPDAAGDMRQQMGGV